MRVALMQSAGRPGDKNANLDELDRAAAVAAADGARVLIAPELFLSGYNIGALTAELAEPSGGPGLRRAAALARRHGVALLFGYPERGSDGSIYNAACCIDRDGALLANYRKTHLYGADENARFVAGKAFVQFRLDTLRVGVLVCYDVEFPEAVRAQALAGCDLVAVPTALMVPQEIVAEVLVPARALENGCFVAYVNRCGSEGDLDYVGLSCLAGPDGRTLVRAGRDAALLCADVDPDAYRDWKASIPYLADRRPALYR